MSERANEHGERGRATSEITFEGRPIPVAPGQSVGAALVAAGITSWRTTRVNGKPRGLFCGIGVCFDCLVTVNGRPSLRACMVEARAGDVVGGAVSKEAGEEASLRAQAGEDRRPDGAAGGSDDV
jgi:hypothetical protein